MSSNETKKKRKQKKGVPEYRFKLYSVTCLEKNSATVVYDRPNARSGHRMIFTRNSLFIFGGFNPRLDLNVYVDDEWKNNCPLFQELWKFNVFKQKWQRLPKKGDMQIGLASCCAVSYNTDYMIIFGGTATPFSETAVNSVFSCHLPSGKWQHIETTGDKPVPGYGQGCVVVDHKLYVVGGTSGYVYFSDVHCLDLKTLHWTLLAARTENPLVVVPSGRYRHEIIEHNNKLYLFGGSTSDQIFTMNILPTYDIATEHWSYTETYCDDLCKKFPSPRIFHVMVKHNNYVVVHGGHVSIDGREYKNVWRLNLNNFRWEKLPFSTPLVNFHAGAITNEGCLYVFGGVHNPDDRRQNTLHKVWLNVPSLRNMAWEAIRFYQPSINKVPYNTLILSGIPRNLVDDIKNEDFL